MRQWKTIIPSEYVIDNRTKNDILDEIEKLAQSYVPEWQFNRDFPDIGSTISLLYADQMEENLKRYNMTLERDYTELVNMMGVSLKPAFPAHSIVLMDMASDTIPGIRLNKGVKLIGDAEGDNPYIFETSNNVYVTESKINSIFYVSGRDGKVIPVMGKFPDIEYVEKDAYIVNEEEDNEDSLLPETEDTSDSSFKPFVPFDFKKDGYGKNGILIYHEHLFDVQNNPIFMEIKGNEALVDAIENKEYSLYYLSGEDFEPVENVTRYDEDIISFTKPKECQKIRFQGTEYSVLLLEPNVYVDEQVAITDIRFSSAGMEQAPVTVWNGMNELESERFAPFGDTLSLYNEVYISHDEYFSKPGSKIKMEFDICFDEHMVSLPTAEEKDDLRVIKRRPKKVDGPVIAEIFAEEISVEYNNGTGWKKVNFNVPANQIFKSNKDGKCILEFTCPSDWATSEVGAYEVKCIRMQLLKSDNCYYMPAVHHYPVIKNMTISYSYEDCFKKPSKIVSYQGSRIRNLTSALMDEKTIRLFTKSVYGNTALYLGFDKKIEDGPVSLFVQVDENEGYMSGNLKYYYYTRDGFCRLKLNDNTGGLAHTGTIQFVPPTDMAKCTLEGQSAYWIRIEDDNHRLEDHPYIRPTIVDMHMNAIEVDNIETLTEDDYYIDAFGPNMEFSINAQNILSVELWVNETASHKLSEMNELLLREPDKCKAEKNFLGEIEEFYRKWEEVDNFDNSTSEDRHFLVDRMNNRIHFGDGVHVMIPRNTSGIAFKVITRCCAGEKANLDKEMITDSLGNLVFVDRIYNPIKAYGGMNMETIDKALRRGTTILNSRRRLVSTLDYEREVLNFSSQIVQARAISGVKKDGTYDPTAITIVVLMEDFKEGPYSFMHLRNRLKEHLVSKCELTVEPDKIEIVEPLFMNISVEAWVKVISNQDAFEIQQSLIEILNNLIDPLSNSNWDIGNMISESQIELRLNMEKGKAQLKRMMISVAYQDENGSHETSIEEIKNNPYVIPVNGTHKIHI